MAIFDRFRKKSPPLAPAPPEPAVQDVDIADPVLSSPLRAAIGTLYDNGVDPIQAIIAMMSERDGHTSTDDKRMIAIWLGISDLLDRDGVDLRLRGELVASRNGLAQALTDTNPRLNTFVANYLASTRCISEKKFLQAYKPGLMDQNGVMQLESVKAMLADIEHQRDTEPGSRAQDISDEALARLYSLRDNWNEPSKLS